MNCAFGGGREGARKGHAGEAGEDAMPLASQLFTYFLSIVRRRYKRFCGAGGGEMGKHFSNLITMDRYSGYDVGMRMTNIFR